MVEYEHIHCPFCGSVEIEGEEETFNYKAGFWGILFLHFLGLLFGFFCRKRVNCRCRNCGGEFSFYD